MNFSTILLICVLTPFAIYGTIYTLVKVGNLRLKLQSELLYGNPEKKSKDKDKDKDKENENG